MAKINIKQEKARVRSLFQLGEQRARSAGYTGPVSMNEWLSEDEQKELIQAISALPQTMAPKLPGLG